MIYPKYIIVHHTATPLNSTFDFVKQIGIDRGFGDISYNFLITANGDVHKGRPLSSVPAHCKADGMNYKSLGLALTGNFTLVKPTQAQLNSLLDTIDILRAYHNIPASNVLAHCEVNGASTLCPGELLKWVKNYRQGRTREQLIRQIKWKFSKVQQK